MKIFLYEQTNQGSRKNNQDYYIHVIREDWACLVLTDGLGGHEKGEVAAQAFCQAVHHFIDDFAQKIRQDPLVAVKELITRAQNQMRQMIQQQYGFIDTQTTFAFVWLDATQVVTAHIGDSRIYRLNVNKVLWRTLDHSHAQTLLDQGKITLEELATHPSQHRLLKTLNLHEPPSADIFVHPPLIAGQTMLLCSDGFWGPLNEQDFVAIAQSDDIPTIIQTLIQKILTQRPKDADNITVQVLKIAT